MSIEAVYLFTSTKKCSKLFCLHNTVCPLSKLAVAPYIPRQPVIAVQPARVGLGVFCDSFERAPSKQADPDSQS